MLFLNLELWKLYDALEKFSSTCNRKKKKKHMGPSVYQVTKECSQMLLRNRLKIRFGR